MVPVSQKAMFVFGVTLFSLCIYCFRKLQLYKNSYDHCLYVVSKLAE
jgi:hypothetical protein